MSAQKIQSLIAKYNKKAEKWGYEVLSFDPSSKELSGQFSRKVSEDSNAFFKNIKGVYRDGYLEEDFNIIQKLISEL